MTRESIKATGYKTMVFNSDRPGGIETQMNKFFATRPNIKIEKMTQSECFREDISFNITVTIVYTYLW